MLVSVDMLILNKIRTNFCIEFALVHILPVGLMICCNIANLRYFLKALQTTQQTLTATVLTAATNYLISVRLFVLFSYELFFYTAS